MRENEEHIAALRKRLAEIEHDMYIYDAIITANPKNATPGDVEVARWRRVEAAALYAAIEMFEKQRTIPLWLYVLMTLMAGIAIVLAGVALWGH